MELDQHHGRKLGTFQSRRAQRCSFSPGDGQRGRCWRNVRSCARSLLLVWLLSWPGVRPIPDPGASPDPVHHRLHLRKRRRRRSPTRRRHRGSPPPARPMGRAAGLQRGRADSGDITEAAVSASPGTLPGTPIRVCRAALSLQAHFVKCSPAAPAWRGGSGSHASIFKSPRSGVNCPTGQVFPSDNLALLRRHADAPDQIFLLRAIFGANRKGV